MKKQEKWSGVKLTKEELEHSRKSERVEIIANIATFLFILVLAFILFVIGFAIMGTEK